MSHSLAARFVLASALAGVLTACSGGGGDGEAAPKGDAPPAIKQRVANFEAIGGAFKVVRGELEQDAPDFTVIAAKATDINARAAQIGSHFPAGTSVDDGYKTEALAAIWQKPEAFKAAAQKLVTESDKLAILAGEGDKAAVGAQAMAMGGACKGCHDKFRLDDES